jgi:hypothetical protein
VAAAGGALVADLHGMAYRKLTRFLEQPAHDHRPV